MRRRYWPRSGRGVRLLGQLDRDAVGGGHGVVREEILAAAGTTRSAPNGCEHRVPRLLVTDSEARKAHGMTVA